MAISRILYRTAITKLSTFYITFIWCSVSVVTSISFYLIDEKVDRYTKDNQWVLVNREEIIWVCGRRISDEVKVTPETTQFAELSFLHNVR